MKPLLSVCLITYNHEKYIEQAIEGVLMQQVNFTWELIIADDCSTDGTREILKRYQNQYPGFIKLILQEKNVGPAQNWKDLLYYPDSKYIAYFEGDDYWTNANKLQKQIDFLEINPGYAICFHEANILYEDGRKNLYNNIGEDKTFDFLDLVQKNFISTASCVFRVYNHHHNLPDWLLTIGAGDWGLNLLTAANGKIYYFNDCMSVYRFHSQGAWSSLPPSEMLVKGLKLMDQLNAAFEFKYNEYFEKAKIQRTLNYNQQFLKPVAVKKSFIKRLKNRIRLIWA